MSGTLVVIEQREITFYDDRLIAVKAEDGRVYAVVSQMCDALGIDTQGQTRRIQRHGVLARGYGWVDILSSQGEVTQRRRAQALRVDLVPLWLSGVRTSSVREEARPKLERFQEEAAAVLWEAFQEGRLTADEPFESLLERADPEIVRAYEVAQAVVRLARNQILLEARLEGRLDQHERRLAELEAALADTGQQVTPAQATALSQAVKAIALALGKKSRRNEFGGVYGELYRRFEIPGYRELPARRFEEAMGFLREWYVAAADTDPPPF